MSNLISAPELHAQLGAPEFRVIDVRASLTDPQAGRRLYAAGHLPEPSS
jgi:3-mercaptopyruvate sulfurtransferase SseA